MHSKLLVAAAAALPAALAEDVLGIYVFHRHGDRTAKAWKPVNLTALGADEAYTSGEFYRSRYVDSDADFKVSGVSSDTAVLSQIAVTSPVDAVLHGSAVTFLQGLYPPTGQGEKLANGSTVEAPLNGYQFIPVLAVEDAATADSAESSGWLQGDSGCNNAEVSSNNYFNSPEYKSTYDGSLDFYHSLVPVINGTYSEDDADFENGYTSESSP